MNRQRAALGIEKSGMDGNRGMRKLHLLAAIGSDKEAGRNDVELFIAQSVDQGAKFGQAPFDSAELEAIANDPGNFWRFARDPTAGVEKRIGGLVGIANAK